MLPGGITPKALTTPASGSGLYLDARAGLLWDDGARLGWKGAHNLDHSSICISTLSTISLYPGFGLSRFSGSPTPLYNVSHFWGMHQMN